MERFRIFLYGGKLYKATMSCAPLHGDRKLEKPSNEEKEVLKKLLVSLQAKSRSTHRGYLISDMSTGDIGTLVSEDHKRNASDKTYYRIDNQMKYDLTKPYTEKGPGPKINLQYQVGTGLKASKAGSMIYMKPYQCPAIFQDELIDVPPTGFRAGQVMDFVNIALIRSSEEKRFFAIGWKIEPFDEERSGSRSRSRSPSKERQRQNIPDEQLKIRGVEMEYAVAKREQSNDRNAAQRQRKDRRSMDEYDMVLHKSITPGETLTAFGAKEVAKASAKAMPLVGLGVGLFCGAWRCCKGDYSGAVMEVVSGATSCVPGGGTTASVAIDLAITARDLKK